MKFVKFSTKNVACLVQTKATISFIIFWDFSMFYQVFLSPQMKRWAIITYKHVASQVASRVEKRLKT